MVSNNINPKYNVPMQALGQSQPGGLSMQAIDTQAVKQTVDNSHISKRLKASDESNFKIPLVAACWLGLNGIADKANSSFAGEMADSSLGRAGAWGDKVSNSIKSTKAGKFLVKVRDKISKGGSWLVGKSKTAYALKNHSTKPEWGFARFPYEGLNGFLDVDIKSLLEDFVKPIKDPIQLEQYGKTKAEIEAVSKSLKGLSSQARVEALHKAELEALGLKPDRIDKLCKNYGVKGMDRVARLAKIKKLGFDSAADYSKYAKASLDNQELLYNALSKADKSIKISAWRSEKALGSKKLGAFLSKIKGRTISVTALRNKLAVVLCKSNAKSTLGRSLQKCMGWLLEGTTGRFGGGKLIPLMMAIPLADGIISAVKAPKGEHGKTLAERVINDFSYVFSLPLAVMGMHKIGGLKYKGMTTDEVADYRKALQNFKNDVKLGKFAGKGGKALRNQAAGNVNKMLKKGFLQRIGRLVNIGNETTATGVKYFMKNCVGVPLRVILAMAVLSPIVSKYATKVSHAIFGRPTNSILDEEKEQVNEQQQATSNQPQNNPFNPVQPIVHNSPTNLLNMYKNGQQYQNSTINNTVNNTIVNNEKVEEDKVLEPVRTYIPSPEGVKVQGEDPAAAEQAMARADAAERKALETLAMKW